MKNINKDGRVSVRVSAALRRELERLAQENEREFSDYIRLTLEKHVARNKKAA